MQCDWERNQAKCPAGAKGINNFIRTSESRGFTSVLDYRTTAVLEDSGNESPFRVRLSVLVLLQ